MNAIAAKIASRQVQILENLATAVLVFDGELHLSYLNPAGEMLLATSARQSLGLELDDLFQHPEHLHKRLSWALANNHPYTERELCIEISDGGTLTVDCTVTPIEGPDSRVAILVELVQVDRHLRIAREELLIEQGEVMRQMVRGLAHEIKNPLGGLRGAAQLLERELDSEELKEYTRIIIGEADRLRQLVNRMLGPNSRPNRSLVNIHHVLEHVRSLVKAEADSALVVTRDYDPSIPEFEADRDLLIQAVLNVVRNAVQAIDARGEIILRTRAQRQFTIGHSRHRLVLRVDVIDNGPGIAPNISETVFFPMVTGRPDGTGLGLSTAQSLVNLHNGVIECQSEPGRTQFTILLPMETPDV